MRFLKAIAALALFFAGLAAFVFAPVPAVATSHQYYLGGFGAIAYCVALWLVAADILLSRDAQQPLSPRTRSFALVVCVGFPIWMGSLWPSTSKLEAWAVLFAPAILASTWLVFSKAAARRITSP